MVRKESKLAKPLRAVATATLAAALTAGCTTGKVKPDAVAPSTRELITTVHNSLARNDELGAFAVLRLQEHEPLIVKDLFWNNLRTLNHRDSKEVEHFIYTFTPVIAYLPASEMHRVDSLTHQTAAARIHLRWASLQKPDVLKDAARNLTRHRRQHAGFVLHLQTPTAGADWSTRHVNETVRRINELPRLHREQALKVADNFYKGLKLDPRSNRWKQLREGVRL